VVLTFDWFIFLKFFAVDCFSIVLANLHSLFEKYVQ